MSPRAIDTDTAQGSACCSKLDSRAYDDIAEPDLTHYCLGRQQLALPALEDNGQYIGNLVAGGYGKGHTLQRFFLAYPRKFSNHLHHGLTDTAKCSYGLRATAWQFVCDSHEGFTIVADKASKDADSGASTGAIRHLHSLMYFPGG